MWADVNVGGVLYLDGVGVVRETVATSIRIWSKSTCVDVCAGSGFRGGECVVARRHRRDERTIQMPRNGQFI
jgi:hypothetical protein